MAMNFSITNSPRILSFLLLLVKIVDGQMVWPQPQHLTSFPNQVYSMDGDTFNIVLADDSPPNCDVVTTAIKRFTAIIFGDACIKWTSRGPRPRNGLVDHPYKKLTKKMLTNLTISFRQCERYPHEDMDESYSLSVGQVDGQARLMTNSPWGVLRGLETFSQLVVRDEETFSFSINGTSILDFPRFSYRGLLVDTSRHFIPVKVLKQNLDAMSYNKLNVFHWHIVDDQSFPMESRVFPDLHNKGSYNKKTHVYRQEDILDVIEFARLRGIRVIPEIDTPGHTLSWGKADIRLLTECFDENGSPLTTFGPLDPTSNYTYKFVQSLLQETAKLFPDRTVHLGGDEVDFSCWKSNPNVKKFMLQNDIDSYEELESYYIQRVTDFVSDELGKDITVWQEVFDNNVTLRPSSTIHVWKGWTVKEWQSEIVNVTKIGHKVILSSPWYLNWINYGIDWPTFYNVEPLSFNGTLEMHKLVIGGSICMWSEFVDGAQFMTRTWPRASAVAERLWSSVEVNDHVSAIPRIRHMQCLMQGRGLRVEPINGPGFCPCDYTYE